jgi:PAS domain-containing protein/DNA-binding CsgD family transcriptional regulator
MLNPPQTRAVAQLYDAAKTPELWSAALQRIASLVGGIGAGHLVQNRRTGAVEWVTVTGPCAELEPRYIDFYAPLDLFAPMLAAAPAGRWLPLSRCVSDREAGRNAWYNDFILKAGIADILAAKIYEDDNTSVLVGIQRGAASDKAVSQFNARIRSLQQPLARAARLHVEFRRMRRALSAANQALQYLSVGVVLTDADGRVLEMNDLAAAILGAEDGLQIRDGRLTVVRSFEVAKFAAAIAGNRHDGAAAAGGHILIGRRGGGRPYAVTIASLNAEDGTRDSHINMVLIVNPDWQTPSERSVAAFFGLSPAESRLAGALMKGRKLGEIARDSKVGITTLRTQLSSILRKVGVERQVDLVRVLSSIGSTGPHVA